MIASKHIYSELPEYATIGNYVSIAEGCTFLEESQQHHAAQNHACVYTTLYNQDHKRESTLSIGNDVWIGREVKLILPVHIGDGAIIGAYSVIAKDVPPFAVVVGNPQVIKRYRFTPHQIRELNRIQWWRWEEKIAQERLTDMEDIEVFINKY